MTLPFPAILAIYVSVPLGMMLLLALFYTIRERHRPIRERESIYQCAQCGHVYAFTRNRPMDHCPRCGHLNDAVRG
jgi:rRNA maturation endonuclease Nob1